MTAIPLLCGGHYLCKQDTIIFDQIWIPYYYNWMMTMTKCELLCYIYLLFVLLIYLFRSLFESELMESQADTMAKPQLFHMICQLTDQSASNHFVIWLSKTYSFSPKRKMRFLAVIPQWEATALRLWRQPLGSSFLVAVYKTQFLLSWI